MKTGIDFRFWAKLHTSLKKLMREVIRCPDSALQKKHLSYGFKNKMNPVVDKPTESVIYISNS